MVRSVISRVEAIELDGEDGDLPEYCGPDPAPTNGRRAALRQHNDILRWDGLRGTQLCENLAEVVPVDAVGSFRCSVCCICADLLVQQCEEAAPSSEQERIIDCYTENYQRVTRQFAQHICENVPLRLLACSLWLDRDNMSSGSCVSDLRAQLGFRQCHELFSWRPPDSWWSRVYCRGGTCSIRAGQPCLGHSSPASDAGSGVGTGRTVSVDRLAPALPNELLSPSRPSTPTLSRNPSTASIASSQHSDPSGNQRLTGCVEERADRLRDCRFPMAYANPRWDRRSVARAATVACKIDGEQCCYVLVIPSNLATHCEWLLPKSWRSVTLRRRNQFHQMPINVYFIGGVGIRHTYSRFVISCGNDATRYGASPSLEGTVVDPGRADSR